MLNPCYCTDQYICYFNNSIFAVLFCIISLTIGRNGSHTNTTFTTQITTDSDDQPLGILKSGDNKRQSSAISPSHISIAVKENDKETVESTAMN